MLPALPVGSIVLVSEPTEFERRKMGLPVDKHHDFVYAFANCLGMVVAWGQRQPGTETVTFLRRRATRDVARTALSGPLLPREMAQMPDYPTDLHEKASLIILQANLRNGTAFREGSIVRMKRYQDRPPLHHSLEYPEFSPDRWRVVQINPDLCTVAIRSVDNPSRLLTTLYWELVEMAN